MEFMYFLVLQETSTNLMVERTAGTGNTPFKYVVFRSGNSIDFTATPPVGASTIVGHANAEHVFATGAVRFDNLYNVQQTSSRGGTLINGTDDRQKPDAVGPTGGRTTVRLGGTIYPEGSTLPGFNFFGTSAAAPHVGAVAAMLLQASAKFSVDFGPDPIATVRNLLTSTAVAASPSDPKVSGAGFVRADLALADIANPTPELLSLEYDSNAVVPGEQEFIVTITGNYFTDESVVYFQGEELVQVQTNSELDEAGEYYVLNSEEILAIIPPFIGRGDVYVLTLSKEGATGDGGQSDTKNFTDVTPKTVVIKAKDITRYYGVGIAPDTHPDLFGFTVEYYDDSDNLVPLPPEELAFFNGVDENGKPFFPVSFNTTAQTDSGSGGTYFVTLEVDIDGTLTPTDPTDDVDPGLRELFRFNDDGEDSNGEIQDGALFVKPIPVEISLDLVNANENADGIKTFVYGEALPEIDYVFNYVDENGDPIPIDPNIAADYQEAHINSFKLVNTFVLVNGGSFKLVNDGQTNSFKLVNCTETTNGTFKLVNCEPEINSFKLVNQTFYVSDAAVATAQANTFKLVNGSDFGTGDTKFIDVDSQLFAQVNSDPNVEDALTNGSFNLVNTFKLVNGFSTFKLVNSDGTFTNGSFKLVNGVEFDGGGLTNSFKLVNGSFKLVNTDGAETNGSFVLVNGIYSSFKLVNGSFKLVNSDADIDPIVPDLENSVVLFNATEGSFKLVNEDGSSTDDGTTPPAPVQIYPVNGITGKDVGYQYIFTGKIVNNDFQATNKPTIVEITPAPLVVTTQDFPAAGDDPVVYGDYGANLPSGKPDFQYSVDEPLAYGEDPAVVLEGIVLSADCVGCPDKYPVGSHNILADFSGITTQESGNYTITQDLTPENVGQFTVNPFALQVNLQPHTVTYGGGAPVPTEAGGDAFTLSDLSGTALSGLPYGELAGDIFTLAYSPDNGCVDPIPTVISATATTVDPNYSLPDANIVDGTLTVNPAILQVQVGSKNVTQSEPIPDSFDILATGQVCNDAGKIPTANSFVVYLPGTETPATTPLDPGTYDVFAVFDDPFTEFGQYTIEQTPGTLFVNAEVGCNERVTASDICKTDLPDGKVRLCFTWVNSSPYDFYIPYGSDQNRFKTRGNLVIQEGQAPSFFPAGETGQFCIITNGDAVQWEIITPGCNSASKSATGSNADPCDDGVALTSNLGVDSFTRELEENAPQAYPNPATDYLTLFVGNMVEAVQVTVFDEVGRQLMTREYPLDKGQSEVYLDISALKEGILTIVTESQGNKSAFRIIKQ
jgi:hypothetical protein